MNEREIIEAIKKILSKTSNKSIEMIYENPYALEEALHELMEDRGIKK